MPEPETILTEIDHFAAGANIVHKDVNNEVVRYQLLLSSSGICDKMLLIFFLVFFI